MWHHLMKIENTRLLHSYIDKEIKPNANQVSLVWFDFAHLQPHINTFQAFLCEEEIKRCEKFYNQRLKNNYSIARGLLRLLISEIVDIDPGVIVFSYNDYGKPFLKIEDASLHFNVSHSFQKVAYAFSCDRLVGVDIEYQNPLKDIINLAKVICTDEEYIFLKNLPLAEKEHFFYKIWTGKEAFIKALGTGLSYPVTEVEVVSKGNISSCLFTNDSPRSVFSLFYFDVLPHYQIALAVQGKDIDVKVCTIGQPD